MVFRKNNKIGAQKFLKQPLDKLPISFRGYEGQHEALKKVPDWQEKLREYTQQLIDASEKPDGD